MDITQPATHSPVSLRRRLGLGLLVLLGAFSYLAWLSLEHSLEQYEDQRIETTRNLAQLIDKDIGNIVTAADRAVLTVRAEYLARLRRGGAVDHSMGEFINMHQSWRSEYWSLTVLNASGDVVQGASMREQGAVKTDIRVSMNRAGRDYF